MWKWLAGAAAVPLVLAGAVYAVGAMLPVGHIAAAERVVATEPSAVAAEIRDIEGQPRWRRAVDAIEIVRRRDGITRYVEVSGNDRIAFDFTEVLPGTRFRSRIADPDLPFAGTWTISVAPHGEAALVRIEERGEVTSPVFRFFSALVFGHDGTMKAYLDDLARQLERPAN